MRRFSLTEFTEPELPYKREITSDEDLVLKAFFGALHSWSKYVDAQDRIILGGGEEVAGKFYAREEDVRRALAVDKLQTLLNGIRHTILVNKSLNPTNRAFLNEKCNQAIQQLMRLGDI